MEYKNILIGNNYIFPNWNTYIKNIKKSNLYIKHFMTIKNNNDIKNIDFILPLSQKDYNIICKKNITAKILYPNITVINLLYNKIYFAEFMLEHYPNNIPKVYYLKNKIYNEPEFPLILKPRFSVSGIGMKILHNMVELNRIKNKSIIQKYITDEYEYGAFMLCIDGEIINCKIIREKFSGNFIKNKHFTNYENIENFDIEIFRKIIKQLNYSGGCNIDFKYVDSVIYIFEINPRFGGSAFSRNFFYDLICIKK